MTNGQRKVLYNKNTIKGKVPDKTTYQEIIALYSVNCTNVMLDCYCISLL